MELGVLAGLFGVAFVSATLLPAQSELALSGVLLGTDIPAWFAVFIAWAGNTSGSCLNWLMGKYALRFLERRASASAWRGVQKAERWYRKYGRWSLLLSWAPVIGDPLTLAAGIMGERFACFVALVGVAKLARYLVIVYLVA